ncbi:MAG: AhpC/TSA family protein [Muribaculaceae bacterium]|nr:AhpC/TSA family protein [Muribaculaceae bacterium]
MKISKNILRRAIRAAAFAIAIAGAVSCGRPRQASLEYSLSDKFEGKNVELISFADSTLLASGEVKGGKVVFDLTQIADSIGEPVFAQLTVDGRIRAFYILEPGNAVLSDTMSVATGTPDNDRLISIMARLDSIEDTNDMGVYTREVEKQYNANKDNVLATYLGVEWLKYADPERVDSMLAEAPARLRESRRADHYIKFARLRAATSPGKPYVDFAGEDAAGKALQLSSVVKPGRWTLVDFWASWCPYCIKELPELKALYSEWNSKGLDIVGVAVRDTPEDTRNSVAKHSIPWRVVYNTERRPYDIYGFSGIPHLMLIGPDGKIVSRGETPERIAERLREAAKGEE